MVTPSERISRIEGILKQMNERLGSIEGRLSNIESQKADKTEMRLLFAASIMLSAAIVGILGATLTRL